MGQPGGGGHHFLYYSMGQNLVPWSHCPRRKGFMNSHICAVLGKSFPLWVPGSVSETWRPWSMGSVMLLLLLRVLESHMPLLPN